ncbi:MAG TPA: ABC transporter permease subunit [Solirubrobacteraceae bacterium]|jgi:ABC-2 type transport system permease protein|nr:ABC transporter permease subunit [Solirubrobacteraceae bacterium]
MSASAAAPPALAGSPPIGARRPSTLAIWRWELRKLVSQKRSYLGFAIAIFVPVIFVIAQHFHAHHGRGGDSIFFAEITQSGLVTPVLSLILTSTFFLPLASALVAGDIVANEDGNGTLKTILTRSVDRGQVFAAKALAAFTYAAAAVFLAALVATVAGIASWGFHDIVSLSGTRVPPGEALLLVLAANVCYLIPIAAIVSVGVLLSTVTRNSAAAVVGTLAVTLVLALIPVIPGLEGARPYLLTTEYNAWQGLLRTPTDWSPIWHSIWVCALYAVPCLLGAYLVFLRRDVAGG